MRSGEECETDDVAGDVQDEEKGMSEEPGELLPGRFQVKRPRSMIEARQRKEGSRCCRSRDS